jgi:hypothetical protein
MRAVSVCALLAGACAPVHGPVDVEVFVRDADLQGGYRLGTVTIKSVSDLFAGRGELFDMRAGQSFFGTPVLAADELDELTPEALWSESRTEGSDMNPDLSFERGRYVARDFDSLHYLTAFYNLEQAFTFLRDELELPSSATKTHAMVSFYGTLVASKALPVSLVLGDNAAFAPVADSFLLVPVILQAAGTPPFMDLGVATHEFHHRVFFHRVLLQDDVFPFWKRQQFPQVYKQGQATDLEDVAASLYTDDERRVLNKLRGVDEGLADLFAAARTEDPDILRSFAPEQAPIRSLEGDLAAGGTYEALEDGTLGEGLNEACAVDGDGDNFAVLGMNPYCLGTLLAGALWESAEEDPAVIRAALLPAVALALDELGAAIAARSAPEGRLVFEVGMLLEAIAAQLPAERRLAACSSLRARFERVFTDEGVPSCP